MIAVLSLWAVACTFVAAIGWGMFLRSRADYECLLATHTHLRDAHLATKNHASRTKHELVRALAEVEARKVVIAAMREAHKAQPCVR